MLLRLEYSPSLLRSTSLQKMQSNTIPKSRHTTTGLRSYGSPPPKSDVHVRSATISWAAAQVWQPTMSVSITQQATSLDRPRRMYQSYNTRDTKTRTTLFCGLVLAQWCFPARRHRTPLRLSRSETSHFTLAVSGTLSVFLRWRSPKHFVPLETFDIKDPRTYTSALLVPPCFFVRNQYTCTASWS